jgi:ABC-2 type transport system ATP-binding protein
MKKVIEVSGLTKRYGEYVAVNNLDLTLEKGEIFGLLGPNGAGKSTTILMLLGLTEPNAGKIKVCGIDPVRSPIEVKKKVGYLPEDVGFYDDYTGLENLIYTARLNDIPKEKIKGTALQTLKKVGLANETGKKVAKYSRGMRQRLGFADVLIKNPEVIILDEPTLGIDPAGVKEFLELIVSLSRENGITVLFSSHHLHQVQQVCDRVGIFVKGNLLAEGKINSLAEQLFSANTCTIKGGIVAAGTITKPANSPSESTEDLFNKINQIDGVVKTSIENNQFLIESKEDISVLVSQLVVNSGFGLSYLSKKAYGLDDIYHQYFQGTAK